jgi:hypothetical protein
MRHSQRGITFIGWLFLLVPIALVLYCAIRVTPMYLNFLNVSKALSLVASQARSGSSVNPGDLKQGLEKNFDVQAVERPEPKDIEIHREGEHFTMIADYEDVAPIFGNISLLLHFHKEVLVQ